MGEFDDLHKAALTRHEVEIDAKVVELAKRVGSPELGELLAQEMRNLRADAKMFLAQRDSADAQARKWEERAERSRREENEARCAMHTAQSEAALLRRLLHDLQVEVAKWPRPP